MAERGQSGERSRAAGEASTPNGSNSQGSAVTPGSATKNVVKRPSQSPGFSHDDATKHYYNDTHEIQPTIQYPERLLKLFTQRKAFGSSP
ncbi:hypothetical protein THAOC_00805 [Thalassiosira oceanica]|uniref:Uncharacterized protein n=1 Tax=Thalassiosira oceanica TaxID=159749 RepID=K0TNQ2_THAOC|nr:hypothetical protein THAOC_00805 [Thalassiosira oceanica]|mmetsp:Transcript_34567/g.77624  ORF Transcript_34567/g.77624 Transcript_34567/m.77624 type:complete len:90 (-) Transcript_34567:13-282(-)|eukprot:EJK77371.1 hypothetical protein THAOC_00805 [Thalassiosira oceanica]